MSAAPAQRDRPVEVIGGLMSAAAIFFSLIGLADRPIRIALFAVILALVASAIGGRHARLAPLALAVATICWFCGMVVAVLAGKPLF